MMSSNILRKESIQQEKNDSEMTLLTTRSQHKPLTFYVENLSQMKIKHMGVHSSD